MSGHITEDDVLDALPQEECFLKSYVNYASQRTDAHALFHLAGGITLLAQAAPIDLHVPLFGANVYANTYCLIVGPSTLGRKTTAVKIANRIMLDSTERKSSVGGKNVVKDFVASTPGSAEALIASFATMPQQVLVYEEWGAFLQASQGDGSTNSFAKIRTALTDLYDGTSAGRSTLKNGQSKNIKNPRLSILAAVATDLLEAYTTTPDWTGGFLARFLTFHVAKGFYDSDEPRKMKLPVDDIATRNYLIDYFIFMRNRAGGFSPCIGLDDEALGLWEIWEAHRDSIGKGANAIIQAGVHRADAFTLKIALLLALDFGRPYEGGPWMISRRELEPAINIAALHLDGLKALGSRIVFASRDMQDRRNVEARIAEAGDVGLEEGELAEKANLLLTGRFKDLTHTLVQQGYIVARSVDGKKRWFHTGKSNSA